MQAHKEALGYHSPRVEEDESYTQYVKLLKRNARSSITLFHQACLGLAVALPEGPAQFKVHGAQSLLDPCILGLLGRDFHCLNRAGAILTEAIIQMS